MKQITIYDLLPLLKKGWVACSEKGVWSYYSKKPVLEQGYKFYVANTKDSIEWTVLNCFNIAPFDGDWKDSLIKVEHKEEE